MTALNQKNVPGRQMRCSQCVLPSNYPLIHFNETGVCNYCNDYDPQNPLGMATFNELLSDAAAKSREYDCLVPFSGGRDSTYVLYQMKNRFKLNVLAFNYDNGFVSSSARDNIQKTADLLGVKVVTLKSARDIQGKYLKYVIRLNLRKSPSHVIQGLCSGCRNGIWGGAVGIAEKYNIPLVIFGESSMESGTAKKIIGRQLRRTREEKIKYALKMPLNFSKRKYYSTLLEKEFPLKEIDGIRKVNYFDYHEWDEVDMLNVINEKLAWKTEQNMNSWRFDCKIHALVNYLHKKHYGFTAKDELYSKMVRENQITREDALVKISENKAANEKELQTVMEVFDKLGLSERERKAILNLENLK